jgi:hypothetical protein
MNHIDQEAELYALGILEDEERAHIDQHLVTCGPCAERVGVAEAAIAALIDATLQRKPERRAAWWPLAAAAAFAITATGLLGQNIALNGALGHDGAILATMVNSHFVHAQFQAPGGVELPAKVIYERHGKWYEIVADGTPPWQVVLVRADGSREQAPAAFARRGAASVAYIEQSAPVKTIQIEDLDGRLIGSVHLVVVPEKE